MDKPWFEGEAPLVIENEIAVKGLIIRHLILPEDLAGTREIMEFISKEISPDSYINIVEQYYPAYKAGEYEPLNRRITGDEYDKALGIAREAGLRRFETLKWPIYSFEKKINIITGINILYINTKRRRYLIYGRL